MLIKFGSFVSSAMIVLGIMRAAMGLFVGLAFPTVSAMEAAKARYLGSTKPWEAVDQGLMLMVAGIAIGLLAKIARNGSQNLD